ncbi:hypothetical protein E2C01_072655 [Portunus trituberculatus]|uniref:Uncharacterized protein n=1 Tax=Portunus trituberculatus TaxID=210409 RepID=A0A5B7I7A1_PORTR|nr:hypothetical protein [Portunus trituberculatus]
MAPCEALPAYHPAILRPESLTCGRGGGKVAPYHRRAEGREGGRECRRRGDEWQADDPVIEGVGGGAGGGGGGDVALERSDGRLQVGVGAHPRL